MFFVLNRLNYDVTVQNATKHTFKRENYDFINPQTIH